MDAIQSLIIVLVGGAGIWGYFQFRQRIELLEHEVRWLRQELDSLKPRG